MARRRQRGLSPWLVLNSCMCRIRGLLALGAIHLFWHFNEGCGDAGLFLD